MALNITDEQMLKKSIQNCSAFQGKYYLWHIYHILKRNSCTPFETHKIARHLIKLTELINQLNNFDKIHPSNRQTLAILIEDINRIYAILAEETGSQGIFYNFRQIILCLCGCILGMIGAIAGTLIGAGIGFFNDIKACRLPVGIFFGAVAGAHVGASIGYRLPDRLVKNPEQHALQYSIRELQRTFESSIDFAYKDKLSELKQKILSENFAGNEHDFEKFLTNETPYEILATDAGLVLSEKVQGYLGHHIWISFTLPNRTEIIRIESGEEMAADSPITQRELQRRMARGEQLLQMLALHYALSPVYVLKLKPGDFLKPENIMNLVTFQYRYKPGVTDCNTYINEILTAVGENPTKTKRFSENDKTVALWMRDAIRFLSPLPKELDEYDNWEDFLPSTNPEVIAPSLGIHFIIGASIGLLAVAAITIAIIASVGTSGFLPAILGSFALTLSPLMIGLCLGGIISSIACVYGLIATAMGAILSAKATTPNCDTFNEEIDSQPKENAF